MPKYNFKCLQLCLGPILRGIVVILRCRRPAELFITMRTRRDPARTPFDIAYDSNILQLYELFSYIHIYSPFPFGYKMKSHVSNFRLVVKVFFFD